MEANRKCSLKVFIAAYRRFFCCFDYRVFSRKAAHRNESVNHKAFVILL